MKARIAVRHFYRYLVLILLVVSWPGLAQAQSPITAHVDRNSLAADEQLVLSVTVSGDFLKIPQPDISQLADFVVVSSSTSTQVSIVNGQMTSQGVFIYSLQPLREGQLVINPISVNVDGQVYLTDPINVEVLPSGSQLAPLPDPNVPETEAPDTLQGQDFYVEAEVDKSTPYLGEQIIYTFRFYQALNFFGQPDYQPPPFTDFWSSDILSQPHYKTEAYGREYLVTEIRTALFPANLGEIVIDPGRLIIPGGLLNPDIKLESNTLTIAARPLPAGAPADFTGAVGEFQIRASLSQTETKVNEPVMLIVEVEGTGNIETLTEPPLPELNNWRVFESQASTTIDTNAEILRGTRSFERLVVPGQPGEQVFPGISFSYYNPETDQYETVSSSPLPILVHPDESQPSAAPGLETEQQAVDRVTADIRHIKPVPFILSPTSALASTGQIFYWSCWIAPLLFVGAVQLWQRRRQRFQRDVAYARTHRAYRVAMKILSEANEVEAPAQAAASGRALLGYLSDKLNQPTVGLTTQGLIELLKQQARLQPALLQRIKELLDQIDISRFAPISEGSAHILLNETRQLIEELEKVLHKRR
jgi:hypothetical protein